MIKQQYIERNRKLKGNMEPEKGFWIIHLLVYDVKFQVLRKITPVLKAYLRQIKWLNTLQVSGYHI